METGMQSDYIKEAKEIIAIDPQNGRPMFIRSGYPFDQWHKMITAAHLGKDLKHCRLIKEDSEEGQKIINGTLAHDLTFEFLTGLKGDALAAIAKTHGVDPKGKPRVVAYKILAAANEGKKQPVA
jgi:hypothetical protein